MTRTTGATDAQIEAATYQYLQTCGPVEPEVYAEAEQIVRHVAFGLVLTDHRIVRVDDLREMHNVALNFRERMVSIVLTDAINRAGGDITQEQMDAISRQTRERWYNTYPEFADACARIESIIGEAE